MVDEENNTETLEDLETDFEEDFEDDLDLDLEGELNALGVSPDELDLTPKEFKVDEYITLKLDHYGKTFIYVNEERFDQCMFLMLNIFKKDVNTKEHQQIDSIDEAAALYSNEARGMENNHGMVKSEVEFWGHCSNIQAWSENNYDPRIIHGSLAFPLLKKLADVGCKKAIPMLKDEIVYRLEHGTMNTIRFFLEQKYFNYFTYEEIMTLRENFDPEHMYSFDKGDNQVAIGKIKFLLDQARKVYFTKCDHVELKRIIEGFSENESEEVRSSAAYYLNQKIYASLKKYTYEQLKAYKEYEADPNDKQLQRHINQLLKQKLEGQLYNMTYNELKNIYDGMPDDADPRLLRKINDLMNKKYLLRNTGRSLQARRRGY